jgi:ATP-dependent Clp protease ATP-binding subunit ClpC
LKDPNRPIGSFIFLGPTGVGKTQLAKELAENIFGDKDALIRVDMSEYSEKFNSTKLIGAPPGYVGHEDGGQLTEKVRRKPYSVVLFDEIEKAHPDIFNSLLQILDEGHITDGLGRKINFKNCLIILTSNVGQRKASEFGKSVGFETSETPSPNSNELIRKELNKTFTPEFLNRIDEVIYFNSLTKENLLEIIEVEIKKMYPRFEEIGYKISISKDLKEKIAERGYDPKYGARPLKRLLQKYIEDTIAELAVQERIKIGSKITISFDPSKNPEEEKPVKVKIVNL